MSKEKSCLLKIVKKTLVNTYTSINRKLVKNKNRTVVHPHKVLLYSIKHSILSENWIYFFNVKRKKTRMYAELIPFIWNYAYMDSGPNWLAWFSLDGRIWGDCFLLYIFLHYLLWNSLEKRDEMKKKKKKKNSYTTFTNKNIIPNEYREKSQARPAELLSEVGSEKILNTMSPP